MKKIAIIDDNKGARSAIKNIIEYNFGDNFKIEEANSVLSGHKLILDFQPDIVLLDVEMGDGTGLDLVELFSQIPFKLVFITAHKEYAIKAIKHRPHGYLLKPVNPFDLIKTINNLLNVSQPIASNEQTVDKIAIKNHDTTVILDKKEIIRLQAEGAYTKIITLKDTYLASKNLKYFETQLQNSSFLRVHNSHLINTSFIKAFSKHLQKGLIMKNGDKISVSVRKTKDLVEFLNKLD